MKRTQLNFELSPDLRDRLDRYSEKSGVPKSEVMRRALEEYLKRKNGKAGR